MLCTKCPNSTVGNSRYCYDHRKESRANFKEMIAAQALEREKREIEFNNLFAVAYNAGLEAGEAAVPTPMIVEEHQNMLDDSSPVEKSYYVPDGVCGFAWVTVSPGNCAFANWLKKTGKGRADDYGGGMVISIHDHRQSLTRKAAHARAMAKVLQEAGVRAYSNSQID